MAAYGCRIVTSRAPSGVVNNGSTWPDLFLIKDTANILPIADDVVNGLPSVVTSMSDHKLVLLKVNGWAWETSESEVAQGRFAQLRRGVRTMASSISPCSRTAMGTG